MSAPRLRVHFVESDPATGEILRWGMGPEIDVLGADIIEGEGAPETHYVKANALVAYTDAQKAAKAKDHYGQSWDNTTQAYVDNTKTK